MTSTPPLPLAKPATNRDTRVLRGIARPCLGSRPRPLSTAGCGHEFEVAAGRCAEVHELRQVALGDLLPVEEGLGQRSEQAIQCSVLGFARHRWNLSSRPGLSDPDASGWLASVVESWVDGGSRLRPRETARYLHHLRRWTRRMVGRAESARRARSRPIVTWMAASPWYRRPSARAVRACAIQGARARVS